MVDMGAVSDTRTLQSSSAIHAQSPDHPSVPGAGYPACRSPGSGRPERGRPGQGPCRKGRPSVREPDPGAGSGAAADSRLYAYVVLSVTTGLRTEEFRALRWKEVDLDAGTVAVYRAVRATADTKTPRCRRVPSLPQLAVRALREHLDRQAGDRLLAGVLWEDHGLDLRFGRWRGP